MFQTPWTIALIVTCAVVALECSSLPGRVAAWVVYWSAARLPGEDNVERYREEWLADVSGRRFEWKKLATALSILFFGVARIRALCVTTTANRPEDSVACASPNTMSDAARETSKMDLERKKRPPSWIREEMILVCALHVEHGWKRLDHNHPAVIELSRLLRSAPYHGVQQYGEGFRNTYSVSRKTSDLKTAHPDYDPHHRRLNGGALTTLIVHEFIADTSGMLAKDARIRASLETPRTR
ncbi:hypothetical protein [Embleya sp. NPDC020886]|uniref:hypothetical protein n=1 Tax=Embleya sp. NPDC020886 TaxID=3363980 RepID=UPI00379A28C9